MRRDSHCWSVLCNQTSDQQKPDGCCDEDLFWNKTDLRHFHETAIRQTFRRKQREWKDANQCSRRILVAWLSCKSSIVGYPELSTD